MKKHILSILCGPVLACNALAFSDASASWVESERACLRAIEAANRPVIPAAPPEAWPLILLLALLLAVSAPGLAKLTRAGLDAVCAFSRDTSRPAFLAGMILVTAALFCGAGKFPTNPVTEIIETVISQTQTPATSAPAVMPETVIPADEEDNAAGLMPATDGNASMLFTSETGTSATSTSASLAASGLALVSATNAVPGWWERPAWASAYAPWALGAHEDAFGLRLVSDTSLPVTNSSLLTLNAPFFPVGTNFHDKLFVSSSGTVSFKHRGRLWPDASPVPDGSDAPLFAVLRGPLGLAPGVGAFWYGSLSNRILLTWQDVYLGRDSNLTASAQAALDPTGDFLLRVKLPASGLSAGFITAAQNNGGGSAFAWDANALALAASPGGIEIRGRGFGFLPAGAEEGDADEDGLANLAEIAGVTHPLRPDSDFDGLGDAAETAGTNPVNPVNPDTDGDGAADSLDPQPLIFTADAVLACCTNTWLFHVQNGLAVDGTSCQLAADAEAWRSERFPVTVTLNAAVPPPGAVLRVGDIPLILREPGTHTLWLPRSSAWHVRLCRQWDFPVDYSLSSPEPGFIFEPAGTQPPAYSGIRYEGVMAVPTPLTIEPTNACFHGKPITFTATGPATGLSGTYTWTYGSAMIITNAPAATFAPDETLPWSVSVTFMPDLAQPPPQSGRLMMLSANADDWPTGGTGPCAYCGRYRRTTWNHECNHGMWCEKTGSEGGCSNSPAYVPPADGTNTWGEYLVINRRAPAPARPAGGSSFTPNPRGHDGYTLPPPEPAPGAQWQGDHWHYAHDCDSGLFDCSGCCDCPEHNGGGGSSSSQPVIFKSSDGVAVAYFSFEGGSWPLSAGTQLQNYGGVYVTGQTPSTSPLDRDAVFTRYDPEDDVTYHEYDRFTVMSLDLQTDHNADGQISAADAPSLALDWNREWRIPANTNAWFPVKVFKDVALPGVYKVSVTGSTNIIVRYGGTCVRGGEPEEVAFPQGQSQETLEVQAAAPETATLTVSFTGTGTATNYNCPTYVSIKAWGVGLGMDANYDGDIDAQDDPLEETQGGLTAVGASALTPLDIAFSAAGTSSGTLTLEALSGGDKIRIRTGNTTNSAAISLPKTWAAGETIPSRIWVQGLSHSDTSRDVSLRLTGSLQGMTCADTVNLTVMQVQLDTEKTLLTLKHNRECNLEIKTIPAIETEFNEYRVDIKRTNSVTWYVLGSNRAITPWHANIAGEFHLRGMAKIGGTAFYSTNIVIVNQFPNYTQIEGDADVRTATDTEWANTLADCTESPNQRRERGFWFRINTFDNVYEHDDVLMGEWVGPDDGASVIFPSRPADIPPNPAPNAEGAVYYVASFHTHTPTTYRTNSVGTRGVGPSTPDNDADTEDNVPGIVYDYAENSSGSGSIPMGHPENATAQRYISLGKTKRSTP